MHKDSLIHKPLGIPPIQIGREPLLQNVADPAGAFCGRTRDQITPRSLPREPPVLPYSGPEVSNVGVHALRWYAGKEAARAIYQGSKSAPANRS